MWMMNEQSNARVACRTPPCILTTEEEAKMRASLYILAAACLAGCAPPGVRPSYLLSPQYQDFNCSQIAHEAERVSRRAVATFLTGEKGDGHAELARLRAEFEALDRVSVAKNCNPQNR
jgi:hypothetical protein